jgi:hypothetical protein
MSVKAFLLVAASILVATPDLAAAKTKHHGTSRSSDPIVNHTGGPISYSELLQIHGSYGGSYGYNARAKHRYRHRTTIAPKATPAPTDVTPAPAPSTVNPPPSTTTPPQ